MFCLLVRNILLDLGLDFIELSLSLFVLVLQYQVALPLVFQPFGVVVALLLESLDLGHVLPFLR